MSQSAKKALLTCALWMATSAVALAASADSRPARMVEVQWGEAQDADAYIVEVRHFEGKLLKTFTSKSPLLKFKAPVGDYQIRARIRLENQQVGQWSEWHRLTVNPKPLDFADMQKRMIDVGAHGQSLKGVIETEWPAEVTATSYLVKVYNLEGEVIHQVNQASRKLKLDLPPGEYKIGITSVAGEFKSEEVFLPQSFVVNTATLAELKVEPIDPTKPAKGFRWQPHEKARYVAKVEYAAFLANDFHLLSESKLESSTASWSPGTQLRPGRYRVSFYAEAEGMKPSKPTVVEFILKPNESALVSIDQELKKLRESL